MPRIPGSFDELERSVEQGAQSVSQSVKKSVSKTLQSTASQIKPAPSDFVKQLYGIKEDAPVDQNQNKEKSQPAASPGEIISPIPFRSEEEIKASAGSALDQVRILPRDEGKTIPLGEQITGQASGSDTPLTMRIDPTKEMTEEEKRMLDEQQKEKREQRRQHEREYIMNNPSLDIDPSLEQQMARVRRQKEEVENQKNQEEEEEKEQERKEKEQQSRQLEPPRGKTKGAPNLAVDKGKKQAEIHRGASG